MEIKFSRVEIGQTFIFRSQAYVKVALSCAEDSRGNGCVFIASCDCEVIQPEEIPDLKASGRILHN